MVANEASHNSAAVQGEKEQQKETETQCKPMKRFGMEWDETVWDGVFGPNVQTTPRVNRDWRADGLDSEDPNDNLASLIGSMEA